MGEIASEVISQFWMFPQILLKQATLTKSFPTLS